MENGKYNSVSDWVRDEWEGGYVRRWDANDMIWQVNTWQMADVSKVKAVDPNFRGDLMNVLGSIRAKALIMPCKTDLYFTVSCHSMYSFLAYLTVLSQPEDNEIEVKAMTNCDVKLVVILSVWGHMGKFTSIN